jgi:hypothetical protein
VATCSANVQVGGMLRSLIARAGMNAGRGSNSRILSMEGLMKPGVLCTRSEVLVSEPIVER